MEIMMEKINPQFAIWEKYLNKYIKKDRPITIMDIGAFEGLFTDFIDANFEIQKGILAEPIPEKAEFLRAKYDPKKISVYQNIISDKDGVESDFFVNSFAETSSILSIKGELEELSDVDTGLIRKIKVVSRTLGSLMKETGIGKIDLIKIDVQGTEHLVLRGANDIMNNVNFIWVETSLKSLYEMSSLFSDIYSLLYNYGFILLEIIPGHRSPKGELLQVDLLFKNDKFN